MNNMIEKFELPMVMGRRDDGTDWVADLASFPHILIGGMAGSGKSSFLRSALAGFITNRSSEELKLIIYDGKACEWMDIKPTFPYLLAPVMMQNMCCVLAWSVREIERRQKLFEQTGCSGLCEFNRRDGTGRAREFSSPSAGWHVGTRVRSVHFRRGMAEDRCGQDVAIREQNPGRGRFRGDGQTLAA